MVIRELITKLGFEVDDSELKMAERRLKQTGEELRTIGEKGMKFITLPLTLVGGFALKSASEIEQLGVSFEVMLGSAEKADNLIKDLIDFATKTPFQMPDVQRNAKMLLGMGLEAEKMIPTMKALGDVAAGTGGNLRRIALNYGQVRTQNKLTGREIRDFAVNGVPILEALAEVLGRSKAEIREMTSRNEVSFADVEKAFTMMTSKGGKFYNLMIKQSKTLRGRLSNLIDSLIKIGIPIGNAIDRAFKLKEAMNFLSISLDKLGTWLTEAPPALKRLIVIGGTIAALLPVIIFGLGSIMTILSFIMKSKFIASFGLLAGKIAIVVSAILILMALFDDLLMLFTGGKSVIGEFFKAIPFMVSFWWEKALNNAKENWKNFLNFIGNYWENFKEMYKIEELIDFFKTVSGGVGGLFSGIFGDNAGNQAENLVPVSQGNTGQNFNIYMNNNPSFAPGTTEEQQNRFFDYQNFVKDQLSTEIQKAINESQGMD